MAAEFFNKNFGMEMQSPYLRTPEKIRLNSLMILVVKAGLKDW